MKKNKNIALKIILPDIRIMVSIHILERIDPLLIALPTQHDTS